MLLKGLTPTHTCYELAIFRTPLVEFSLQSSRLNNLSTEPAYCGYSWSTKLWKFWNAQSTVFDNSNFVIKIVLVSFVDQNVLIGLTFKVFDKVITLMFT